MRFPVDTRMRRRLQKQDEIRELEKRRDKLVDQGFLNRATAVENQISLLRKQVEKIEME